MNERIFITAGGSGHRLDEAEGIPKALMKLPDGKRVIERQLEMIPQEIPVTICTGYRDDLIEELYPDYDKVKTYDPKDPVGILVCIKHILKTYSLLDGFIFLLGDTVWHPNAFAEALSRRHDAPIVYYGQRARASGETYFMSLTKSGAEIILSLLDREIIEPPTRASKIPPFSVKEGKIWMFDRWCEKKFLGIGHGWSKRMRMMKSFPVDDFDIDEQYHKVWKDYKDGVYDA